MNWIRFGSLLIALSLHGGVLYLIGWSPFADNVPLGDDAGADTMTVVATVDLEGRDLFTQAAQEASIYANAAKAEAKDSPKTGRLQDEIKPEQVSEQALAQQLRPKEPQRQTQETLPREEGVEQADRVTQAASVASNAVDAQIAASMSAAKRASLWSAYKTELYSMLERFKKKPNRGLSGDVLLSVTIAPTGDLLNRAVVKSSGIAELDATALASIDRAAPFSPIPAGLGRAALTIMVPFEYRVR
jgi:protein TonB